MSLTLFKIPNKNVIESQQITNKMSELLIASRSLKAEIGKTH